MSIYYRALGWGMLIGCVVAMCIGSEMWVVLALGLGGLALVGLGGAFR